MTRERIEELEALEKAATRGQWESRQSFVGDALRNFLVRPGIPDGLLFGIGITLEKQHDTDVNAVVQLRNAAPELIADARTLAKLRPLLVAWANTRNESTVERKFRLAADCDLREGIPEDWLENASKTLPEQKAAEN